VKKVRTTNPELIKLMQSLRKESQKNKAEIWRHIADSLSHSRSRRIAVNVSRLNRYTEEGETVAVPGKVLGAGKIDHPINVAAFAFSDQARTKILGAKGKCLSIQDLMDNNRKGANVKVIG
jgi:large subunit ribosomal protein L18e